jgi:hypothetical protein
VHDFDPDNNLHTLIEVVTEARGSDIDTMVVS